MASDAPFPPWTAREDLEPQRDRLDLTNVSLLGEVTHPVRGLILRRLKEPASVAELAAQLDVPVTRLYHHVNRLEQHGLIRVVATRRVGAVLERRYQVVARSLQVADELFETDDPQVLALALGSLFDVAKAGLQASVANGAFAPAMSPLDRGLLSLGELQLSPERRRELNERLLGVIEDFVSDADTDGADDPRARRVTLFVASFSEVPTVER